MKIEEALGDQAGIARSLHNIGNLHYLRGEYAAALEKYEQSLKIEEALGDQAGAARSHGQIGQLFTQTGRYAEAFEHLLFALSTFVELQSPNVEIIVNMLKELRARWGKKGFWGEKHFDIAWREAIGEAVPDGLK